MRFIPCAQSVEIIPCAKSVGIILCAQVEAKFPQPLQWQYRGRRSKGPGSELSSPRPPIVQGLVFFMWRSQLGLVSRLLGISGRGLSDNTGLVGAALGLQV